MKNIIKLVTFVLMATAFFACSPQDNDNNKLGPVPTADELDFTIAPSAKTPNILEIKNTSKRAGVATWDLGNGLITKAEALEGEYPFKGEYDIVLTLYTTGGATSITKKVTIADNDFSLLNTEKYNFLGGGFGVEGGKTWVFDSAREGHIGVGPKTADKPEWWSAAPDAKVGSSLYEQEFTFVVSEKGAVFNWKNKGKVYTNETGKNALAKLGYPNAAPSPADDFDVEYTPKADNTFKMIEGSALLILDNDAFFGHYIGASKYSIVKLTNDELYVKAPSELENSSWWYRFVPKK